MSRTGVFMNWDPVAWIASATGSTSLPLPEVKAVKPELKGELKEYSGGAAPGPRVHKLVNNTRQVTVMLADIKAAEAIPFGVQGTLTATLRDLYNEGAAGGGALVMTLNNCMRISSSPGGEHDNMAMTEIVFAATWGYDPVAGTYTDPLVFVPA